MGDISIEGKTITTRLLGLILWNRFGWLSIQRDWVILHVRVSSFDKKLLILVSLTAVHTASSSMKISHHSIMPKIETWNTTGLEIEINIRISEYVNWLFQSSS